MKSVLFPLEIAEAIERYRTMYEIRSFRQAVITLVIAGLKATTGDEVRYEPDEWGGWGRLAKYIAVYRASTEENNEQE